MTLFDYQDMPVGYIVCKFDGTVLEFNSFLEKLLDKEADSVRGKKKFVDLLTIGGKLFYETSHIISLRASGSTAELSYDLKHKNGDRVAVIVNSKVKDSDSGLPLVHHILFPAKGRKLYERELLQAKKTAEIATEAKSAFLATMTHEIRTPLHSITNATSFLIEDDPRADQMQLLEVMDASVKSLMEIINNVLDLSKFEAGDITLTEKSVDLTDLMNELIKIHRLQANIKNTSLTYEIDKELSFSVMLDRAKIKQVISNLLSNSIKFTENGDVKMSVKILNSSNGTHSIAFEVSDTGIGIDESQLEQIFEAFAQADNSIHENFGGTGLGLSISKKIIETYGSKIQVQSALGKGTTISFVLKLKQAKEADVDSNAQKYLSKETLQKLKILIVDDVMSNILIAKRHLEKWGMNCFHATSGEVCLLLTQANPFDLILMDLNMPGLSGVETANRIRSQDGQNRSTTIVAVSAYDIKYSEAQIVESDIHEIIQKPYDQGDLYQLLTRTIGDKNLVIDQSPIDNQEGKLSDSIYVTTLLKELYGDDEPGMIGYMRAVRQDLTEMLSIFDEVTNTFDLTTYKDVKHKSISMIRMLSLDDVKVLLEKGLRDLEQDRVEDFLSDIEQVSAKLNDLANWIDTL